MAQWCDYHLFLTQTLVVWKSNQPQWSINKQGNRYNILWVYTFLEYYDDVLGNMSFIPESKAFFPFYYVFFFNRKVLCTAVYQCLLKQTNLCWSGNLFLAITKLPSWTTRYLVVWGNMHIFWVKMYRRYYCQLEQRKCVY